MDTHPTLTDEQAELLPALVEGRDPDAWVVLPVSALSTRLLLAWTDVAKSNRGEVTRGKFTLRLMRSLSECGFIVDTAHRPDPDQVTK